MFPGVVNLSLGRTLSRSFTLTILSVVLDVLVLFLILLGSLLSKSGRLVRTFLLVSVSFLALLSQFVEF